MKRIQRELPLQWRQGDAPSTDVARVQRLIEKLTFEINHLNRNLRAMETGARERDVSALQTCKEMIRSRERLCRQLRQTAQSPMTA